MLLINAEKFKICYGRRSDEAPADIPPSLDRQKAGEPGTFLVVVSDRLWQA
jgi:hypothetical protein